MSIQQFTCLLLASMLISLQIIMSPHAAAEPITCEWIQNLVAPCSDYITSRGVHVATGTCCNGLSEVLAMSPTKHEKKVICSCDMAPSLPDEAITLDVVKRILNDCKLKVPKSFAENFCNYKD